MAKFFERNSTKLTISEFYDNYKLGKYNFEAAYQRKSNVWSEDKKAFLMDSIFKNYPVPAIFLRPLVDDMGKTRYDVIDGKQRLQAIITFIENCYPLTSYFAEDSFITDEDRRNAEEIAGKTFNEIREAGNTDYVKQFWTYTLQIEYLYEGNSDLVSSVFDRLNRNGEHLTPQELRNAKYANTEIIKVVRELAADPFMKEKLERLKIERMEDEEFVSELLFLVLDKAHLDSLPDTLDAKYEEYKNEKDRLNVGKEKFKCVIKALNDLSEECALHRRVYWTTHLYTLFSVVWYCIENKILIDDNIKQSVKSFYDQYFQKGCQYEGYFKDYKEAASSRTRSAIQRQRRMDAVLKYCNIK